MSTVSKPGSIQGSQISDAEIELSIYRDGQQVKIGGAWNFKDFLSGYSITESITNSAIQARFVMLDNKGFSSFLTGCIIHGSPEDMFYYDDQSVYEATAQDYSTYKHRNVQKPRTGQAFVNSSLS